MSFNKTNNLMYFYKRCNPQKLSLSNPKKTNTSDFLILKIRWIDKLILKIYLQFNKLCVMVKFLIYWFLFLMWEEVKTSFPMFHMGITECCTCIGKLCRHNLEYCKVRTIHAKAKHSQYAKYLFSNHYCHTGFGI